MWKMKIKTKHPKYHQRSSVSKYSITLWWASNTLTIYSEARQINHIFASLNSWKSWLCQFVYLYVYVFKFMEKVFECVESIYDVLKKFDLKNKLYEKSMDRIHWMIWPFVCLFEWMPSQRKESRYPVIGDFATLLALIERPIDGNLPSMLIP